MKILLPDTLTATPATVRLAADSAWRPDRRPLFVPEGRDCLALSLHTAVRISRLGKGIAPQFAPRYYDAWAPAVLPDLGQGPLLIADDSVVLGSWQPLEALPLEVSCDGVPATVSLPGPGLNVLLAELSQTMTFKTGDIIILPPPLLAVTKRPGEAFTLNAAGSADAPPLMQFNVR